MILIEEARQVTEWAKQTRAVAAHLEKYGELYKHQATRETANRRVAEQPLYLSPRPARGRTK